MSSSWITSTTSFLSLLFVAAVTVEGFFVGYPVTFSSTAEESRRQTTATTTTALYSSRRIWRERADPTRHRDFMFPRGVGGKPVEASRDNLLRHYVYFLRLDKDFCFVFNGLAQVYQCREYFSRKLHPSTRNVRWRIEEDSHDLGPWFCRLPKGITETKRQRILKQLDALIEQYGKDYDFVYQKRYKAQQAFDKRTTYLEELKDKRDVYRTDLKQRLLQQQQGGMMDLPEVVWSAIQQTTCPDKRPKQKIHEVLQSQVRVAERVVGKISPPIRPSSTTDDSSRPISKRRKEQQERQRREDLEALKEVGRSIKLSFDTMEDTRETLENYRRERKGSSSEEFQTLLNEIKDHEVELGRVSRSIGKQYFRLECGA